MISARNRGGDDDEGRDRPGRHEDDCSGTRTQAGTVPLRPRGAVARRPRSSPRRPRARILMRPCAARGEAPASVAEFGADQATANATEIPACSVQA